MMGTTDVATLFVLQKLGFSEEKFHNPDKDGYTSVRLDRSKKKSSKEKGGGLVMYVDKD